jgi:hypothetical protein
MLTLDESQELQHPLFEQVQLVEVGLDLELKVPISCDRRLAVREPPDVEARRPPGWRGAPQLEHLFVYSASRSFQFFFDFSHGSMSRFMAPASEL